MLWPWGMTEPEPPRKKRRRPRRPRMPPQQVPSESGWEDSEPFFEEAPWTDTWRPATDPFAGDSSRSYEREIGGE